MPHLLSFRKGWESENLARYLLHKFSFIANPSTISDDIGTDYYCTIFEIKKNDKKEYLYPKNTFAIQIKSSIDDIDISDKLSYLELLEIPFFIGYVDKKDLSLSLYSGEYITPLFSLVGIPKKVNIKLYSDTTARDFYEETGEREYQLLFPYVTKISATQNEIEFRECVKIIANKNAMMYKNIVSKMNEEYIFKFNPGYQGIFRVMAFAGPGSVAHFRNNLIERMGEVFNNLYWILKQQPEKFNYQEFQVYDSFYKKLKELGPIFGTIPEYIELYYRILNAKLREKA